jgi:hypothetical protein
VFVEAPLLLAAALEEDSQDCDTEMSCGLPDREDQQTDLYFVQETYSNIWNLLLTGKNRMKG